MNSNRRRRKPQPEPIRSGRGGAAIAYGVTTLPHNDTNTEKPMKPFIRISPTVEYSTDYDFFILHQILIFNTQEGTVFCSGLESREFLRTATRNLSGCMTKKICRQIHRDICSLCYGGELTD